MYLRTLEEILDEVASAASSGNVAFLRDLEAKCLKVLREPTFSGATKLRAATIANAIAAA